MDNRNFYSMPAPWGGIVIREENGELASICPTIASIQAPSPAPLAIADAMQQLEAVLTVPQATSEELRETLFATQVFRKLPDFTRCVLDIVSRIEPGQWMSYSQVAQATGNRQSGCRPCRRTSARKQPLSDSDRLSPSVCFRSTGSIRYP